MTGKRNLNMQLCIDNGEITDETLFMKQIKWIISVMKISILLSFLLLCLDAENVYAIPDNVRLAGLDRYDTAVAIAKQGWEHSDYAILAFGENFPDALAAAPLAKKYDAPILLTGSTSLNAKTKQTISDLKVKNVFIVGGTSVVSAGIENELQASGLIVTRLAGSDRYDTSIEIAKKLDAVTSIMVATGEDYADALSVGSIAGKLGMPIIIVPQNTLPESVKSYVASHNIKTSYIVGNQDRISSICLATGNNFADALTGTAYASKNSLPIVLVPNDLHQKIQYYIASMIENLDHVVIFGGEAVVSTALLNDYLKAIPKVTINNEAQLVTRLNTRANYVSVLYNSNSNVLGLALLQLVDCLDEIENRLNASNFTYGDNLINAIKATDTIISGMNLHKEGLTVIDNPQFGYTLITQVLNSVKSKLGIQTPVPEGTKAVRYDYDKAEVILSVSFVAHPQNLNEENWLTVLAGGSDKPINVVCGIINMMKDGKTGIHEEFIKIFGSNGSKQFLKYSGNAVFESGQSLFQSKKVVGNSLVKDDSKSLILSYVVDADQHFMSITLNVFDDVNFADGSRNEMPHSEFYIADISTLKYFPSSLNTRG